jgi:hypothetical protein
VRDQYERFEIEREEILMREQNQWIHKANEIRIKKCPVIREIIKSDYYKADGLSPEEYVDHLLNDYLYSQVDTESVFPLDYPL